MKKEDLKKLFQQSLSTAMALSLAVVVYFLILRFSSLVGFFGKLGVILTPFIYGAVLAYLLKTPCNFLEHQLARHLPQKWKKKSEALSVLLTVLLAVLTIYLLLCMVIPEVTASITTLFYSLPRKVNDFSAWITKVFEGNEVVESYITSAIDGLWEKLNTWINQDLLPTLQGMMGGFATTVSSIVGVIGNLVIGIIVCIYLLFGKKTFKRQAKAGLYALFRPEVTDSLLEELQFIDKTFVGFFAGKILDSAIVGVICYAFCLILSFVNGFPNAMLISVIVGVTNIIPYFGPFIGAIPSALLILAYSPINCLIFLIFVVILQQFDGNILGPRLLADSVGISGFWVLFSITVFSGFFGFAGVLVGVPVFAVIYDLVRRWIVKRLEKHGKSEVLISEE